MGWSQDKFTTAEILQFRRATNKRFRDNNPETRHEGSRNWRRKNPVKALLQGCRSRAKKRGMEFDLVAADLYPLPTHCPVFKDIELKYWTRREGKSGRKNWAAASIDRRDSSRGYVKDNVAIMSLRANTLKRDGSLAEFDAIVTYLRGNPTHGMTQS
jgi:hypothetical protein